MTDVSSGGEPSLLTLAPKPRPRQRLNRPKKLLAATANVSEANRETIC